MYLRLRTFMYYVMVTAKLITILVGMEVGLKSFVISRTTGLYGLKFVKSSALADDFLT